MNTSEEKIRPLKRFNELSIAIPASFVSDIPHLREKTFRIGLIGRAAAVFRADEVIVYSDVPSVDQRLEIKLIETVLSYLETPQYLRRRLFKIVPELQYAGTLPPLRTPHHPTASKTENLSVGEYREGVVVSRFKGGSMIDIGVEQPALAQGPELKVNARVTVKVTESGKHLKAVVVDPKEISTYWGYRVSVSDLGFARLVRERRFDLVIATSKKGKPISSVLTQLGERWRTSHATLVAFGAPTQGLYEVVARELVRLDDMADFVVNTIPNQATETVRTEEAVYATLSILNMLNK